MIKLIDILKENKKPVKEIVGILTVGALISKFIIPWLKKNPGLKDKLQDEINKVDVTKND